MKQRGCGCAFFLALSLALIVGLAAWLVPARAQAAFGEPSPNLSAWERWRLSFTLLTSARELTTPNPTTAGKTFVISPGENAAVIAQHLQAAGIIPDAEAWLAYLRYKGWDTALQAGRFRFDAPLTPMTLVQVLKKRPETDAVLVVLPGWRREEIAAALPSSGLRLSPEDFLAATAIAEQVTLPFAVPPTATLEGFLLPGKYVLPRDAGTPILLDAMLTRAYQWFSPQWQQEVRNQGLTPYQALILASIVQRETKVADEMPLIAAVYLNRLRRGMPLEADPTVQYALGKPGRWWPSPLSAEDLKVDSPYNTYLHPGLPPSPIANPGLEAIQAVATAPQTDYLFFRAKCDGSGRHEFARTFQQHLQNACP
ncbi:MAG: endolytic transglycosylase MltG [Chloroflexi bacterium]|nr:endolytic transglycosylase MltG [Chloroflexota bacterium]